MLSGKRSALGVFLAVSRASSRSGELPAPTLNLHCASTAHPNLSLRGSTGRPTCNPLAYRLWLSALVPPSHSARRFPSALSTSPCPLTAKGIQKKAREKALYRLKRIFKTVAAVHSQCH